MTNVVFAEMERWYGRVAEWPDPSRPPIDALDVTGNDCRLNTALCAIFLAAADEPLSSDRLRILLTARLDHEADLERYIARLDAGGAQTVSVTAYRQMVETLRRWADAVSDERDRVWAKLTKVAAE